MARIVSETLTAAAIGTPIEIETGQESTEVTEIATGTSTRAGMTLPQGGTTAVNVVKEVAAEIVTPVRSAEAITTTGGLRARRGRKHAIMK